jgi:hypothetical protein
LCDAHSFHTKLCSAPHHYHLALAALQPLAAGAGPVPRLLIEGHKLVDQGGGLGRQRNGDRGGGDVGSFIGMMSALRAPSDANPLVTELEIFDVEGNQLRTPRSQCES